MTRTSAGVFSDEHAVIPADTPILPSGMDPVEHEDDVHHFALHVR